MKLSLAALLLFATAAHAIVAPVSIPAVELKRYDTLHEAAMRAALRLEECSHYYECSSVIVRDPVDGKFLVGPTRTDYASDSVEIFKHVPARFTLVADVHSHPCLPNHYTGFFSPDDAILSLTSRVTSYMVDLCTGSVHEFIPGTTRVDDTEVESGRYLTEGAIIGRVPAFPNDPTAKEGF